LAGAALDRDKRLVVDVDPGGAEAAGGEDLLEALEVVDQAASSRADDGHLGAAQLARRSLGARLPHSEHELRHVVVADRVCPT